ncbi:hypothetical protein AMATHDRAFT_72605 [Amanita thiersii Skay4041]|uniref:C3H1-type domain-containing protein n=1 Tax=Amanita thiersii Skay4041 TaxID=703135 RepID=A0A2A9NW91_9AGAR|nr:hypothetical protein AMATHDRAFT_72605 [Amanita thiersii Skay4041]
MVSPLWKACSQGDLTAVCDLLNDASTVDIEIKDHTGVTPLIEAIRNAHVEVVRALLDKGADPTNSSSQGPPEHHTSDPVIIELLSQAQRKMNQSSSQENTYQLESSEDADKRYYAPPYPYYPTLSAPPPPMPDGAPMYYPPPPPPVAGENHAAGGIGNLPPPEIARFIPCRYFPACRYGSSCIFAHPQTPYYQGPMPPPQYPPYDPSLNAQPFAPNYYAVSPPAFQPPNGVPHMTPISPPGPPQIVHGRSPSEVAPPSQNPYTANGVPLPYNSMPPSVYPHQGQVPLPMSVPPLPTVHHLPPLHPPGPQSPSTLYNQAPLPTPMFNGPQDNSNSYPPPLPPSVPLAYPEINGDSKASSSNAQSDGFGLAPHAQRDGIPHGRRGTGRGGSFGGRKPACIFFPSGRCKNGDDCRFPHVLPDSTNSQTPSFYSNRGTARGRSYGTANGFAAIDEKLANMNIRDVYNHHHSSGGRSRFNQGSKNYHGSSMNGIHTHKKGFTPVKQRVPNADEFPVLGGSITPPNRNTNGLPNGAPTAAQVLQAPPPTRKDTSQSSTRGTTPDFSRVNGVKDIFNIVAEVPASSPITTEQSQQVTNKLPVSFAAAANSNTDVSKEVSVSA